MFLTGYIYGNSITLTTSTHCASCTKHLADSSLQYPCSLNCAVRAELLAIFRQSSRYKMFTNWTVWNAYPFCKVMTYFLLTPRSRFLLEKLTVSQLANKFQAFYLPRRFNTTFTRSRQLYLSWTTHNAVYDTPPHCLMFHYPLISP